MPNIAKTDINSPGSTSQQERRQEKPLKVARNHRQACLNAETKEQRQLGSDDMDRNRRQTNGKSERSAGCTFVAKSRVRSLQYAVFQPIFLQTLQTIGKCKRLQERLTVERRLCYLAENTARWYVC